MQEFVLGCFGSALAHDPESEICKQCDVVSKCGVKAAETAELLKKELGIACLPTEKRKKKNAGKGKGIQVKGSVEGVEAQKQTSPESVSQAQSVCDTGLAKKPADLVSKVLRLNIDVGKYLKNNVNPFESKGPSFLKLACGLLLKGGFTKKELKLAFMQEFGWSEGSASSHVSIACAAIPALRAAVEIDGRFIIGGNNNGV